MSSVLDGMSDDDNGSGNDRLQQWIQGRTDEQMPPTLEDDVDKGSRGQPVNEGLNPWSIAKLTSTNRTAGPAPERPMQGPQKNHPKHLELGLSDKFDRSQPEAARPIRSREGPKPQPSRQDRLENPASQGRYLQEFPSHASRRAPALFPQPPKRHSQPRGSRVLQSPPTSSFCEHLYDDAGQGKRPGIGYKTGSGHLVQSQISFGMNTKRKHNRDQADLDFDQQSSEPSRLSRHTSGSESAHRLDPEEANFMMTGANGVDPRNTETVSQASPPHRPRPQKATRAARDSSEASAWEESNQGPAEPDMATGDPRAQLIKQQCLMTQNPQKKLKRLKTEQLPFEAIPRDSQTCTLSLTMKINECRLAQLFPGASQFDTWLADGKLRGAFKDGIHPESLAMLVKPLLTRTGQAASVTA